MKSKHAVYPKLGLGTLLSLLVAGCASESGQPDYTTSGAVVGGATGALIGGLSTRHHVTGALVGGAVGAVAGGAVGHGLDRSQQSRLQAQAPQTWQHLEQGQPLTLEDVKAMSRTGASDQAIVTQIQSHRTVYRLTNADLADLRAAGVSEGVIAYMLNTPRTIPR